MAVTPDEIRAKSFPAVKKGGLDPEVVTSYLTTLADEVERLEAAAEEARKEAAAALAAPPAPVAQPAEPPAPRPLGVVGSHVDEVLEAAQRSAEAIVRDTEDWSTEHKASAEAYAKQIRSQVDELRETTEHQAESFRAETVAYATKIREDAEAAAESMRSKAEADAAAQYERLTIEATERWEAVKTAERDLLARLDVTRGDIDRAHEHFRVAVAKHEDTGVIEPDAAMVDSEVVEPPTPAPEPMFPELDDPAYVADADTDDVALEADADIDEIDTDIDEFDTDIDDADQTQAEAAWAPAEEVTELAEAPAPPPPPAPAADAWATDTDDAPAADAWATDPDDAPAADAWATDPDDAPAADAWATDPDDAPAADAWATDPDDAPAADAWATDPDDAPVADTDEAPTPDAPVVDAWASAEEAHGVGEPVDAWTADQPSAADGAEDTQHADAATETVASWGADDDTTTTSWDAADDQPSTGSWGAVDETTTTSWGAADDEPSTDSWGTSDDAAASWDEDTATEDQPAWSAGASADPWATEPASPTAGLVTGDEVGGTEASSGSFFNDSAATATEVDDDPLAAMVREAVDRVTDGDGAN